jgi:hypothetical protein
VYLVIVFLSVILPMLLLSSKLKRNLIISQNLTLISLPFGIFRCTDPRRGCPSFHGKKGLKAHRFVALCTSCTTLCYTCTYAGMRTTISLLSLFEVKPRTCRHTPCRLSLHSLQEFSGRETIEIHTLPLIDFIQST